MDTCVYTKKAFVFYPILRSTQYSWIQIEKTPFFVLLNANNEQNETKRVHKEFNEERLSKQRDTCILNVSNSFKAVKIHALCALQYRNEICLHNTQ